MAACSSQNLIFGTLIGRNAYANRNQIAYFPHRNATIFPEERKKVAKSKSNRRAYCLLPPCDSVSINGAKENKNRKGNVFLLDANSLCYIGNNRDLSSFARWISIFFKKIYHKNPVVAVSTTYSLTKQAIKAIVILIPSLYAPAAFAAVEASGFSTGVGGQRLSSAWMGFVAGCLHTLSGPDHLAALAPLSIGRTHIESIIVGALWGCGHDAGQLIFGLLFLLVKDRLHIEVIRTWSTRIVGLTLVVIGVMGIREASEGLHPCVPLENGKPAKKKMGFATFVTGIVHGLQPDSLLIILPALALPSRWDGATFLVMFLLGTVVAMGGYTLVLTSCSRALKERIPKITEKMTWVSSVLAIGLGSVIFIGPFFGFGIY